VKPSFEIFSQLNSLQARKYLVGLIVDSTDVMTRHQSKFPNFDITRFKEDLRVCLRPGIPTVCQSNQAKVDRARRCL